ncbi:Metallo-dependent phosphatase-like protein [Scheffersomyces xylosifermentans]|uniref:Metallo-dependent phosphatase-like protein n=1 Tax=Scheffersomyces xylosifermentans TaxID=1304137 RepID=UPI00315DB4D9
MSSEGRKVRVAVEGCCHGELNSIYKSLEDDVELLLICGDFQAIRNQRDLDTMNVPKKYKKMADFHEYYKGAKTAPVLTIFIGGNHECSSYLKELKFGGWVAPNIYYLGEFGSVWYKGIQICGWSGIFNYWSFLDNSLDAEALPYTDKTIRSAYHTSPKNFLKMYLMNHDLDIALSHDWPVGIEKHGDVQRLLRKKQFFKNDIRNGTLGSPLNKFLLSYLRPRYWFSGHLHVRFEAWVSYKKQEITKPVLAAKIQSEEIDLDMDDMDDTQQVNDEELSLDMDADETVKHDARKDYEEKICIDRNERNLSPNGDVLVSSRKRFQGDAEETSFLALDKCLPGRQYLEVIEVPVKPENEKHPSAINGGLYWSRRAICINKIVEDYVTKHRQQFNEIKWGQISKNPLQLTIVDELREYVQIELKKLNAIDDSTFEISHDSFKIIAPVESRDINVDAIPLKYWDNNQTTEYKEKFGIKSV